jgi:UDP-N-acetylglucosamine--N-acetylmuramyl-(pentapeptide) pyrophosphoryl-undecaprenol N-acetylglucosamine transferase
MGKHLLVCSGGGHLKQLFTLAGRMDLPVEDQYWVTFETGLSRQLLAGRNVVFARYAAPRDTLNILRNAQLARRILGHSRFQTAISTGSSIAVNFLPLAARMGASAHYIESAARADGPSLTGRILALDPQVNTYCQYPAWSGGRWQFRGSIFDAFGAGPTSAARPVRRAVVTVGTTESYGFRRLFDALVPLLQGSEVLWQTGTTDVTGLGIPARPHVDHGEMLAAVAAADVVVAHSGTGAALTAIELGKTPVLVPRLARHHEHIDDHQLQIAAELARRGLAVMCPPEELDRQVLELAAARSTVRLENPPPFELSGFSLAGPTVLAGPMNQTNFTKEWIS